MKINFCDSLNYKFKMYFQQGSEEEKKPKLIKKKIKTPAKVTDEECFVCGDGGELLLCDNKTCTKGYHLSCLNKTKWPQGMLYLLNIESIRNCITFNSQKI